MATILDAPKLKPNMRRVTQFVRSILFGAVVLFAVDYGWIPARAQSTNTPVVLNEAERALVAGSRTAIVRTGISEGYFDRHFALVKVFNQPGDRRIVWKFSVNGYSTIVPDVLGYYTKDGKRVDIHSVASTLRATSEITRTISRKTANQIMQRCIGRFANPSVEYRSSPTGPATLVLTAEAVSKSRPREDQKQRESRPKAQLQTDMDVIKEKGKRRPPIVVGSIDLQSGKCTRGELLSGPSVPASWF